MAGFFVNGVSQEERPNGDYSDFFGFHRSNSNTDKSVSLEDV